MKNLTKSVYIAIIRTTLLKFVLESDYKSCCHEDLFTFTRSELSDFRQIDDSQIAILAQC
jgi:hypothetical protein